MLKGPVEIADIQESSSPRWPQVVPTRGTVAPDTSAFVSDELSLPLPNPWNRNVRAADLDFFDGGDRAAVVTFSGDVWLVSGIDRTLEQLQWKRFASGLYEPLSLSIVDGDVYVYGREGIVRLHDQDGNGEADFYENFSNLIVQSTETREWPLDMVPQPGGGFFLSMGGALNAGPRTGVSQESVLGFRVGSRHAGSVTQVSANGDSIRVFADGFREPYLGVHPTAGILTASDQQGNFVPSTPIYVVRDGGYFGVPASTQREGALPNPEPPLTWIPHQVDPSGASQVWVESDQMGPLNGTMVHLSYSRPGPFRVYMDTTQTPWQGGVRPIAGDYVVPTSKGQMNSGDGQLYIAGFQVWGTTAEKISSLLRLRYTEQPSREPTQMRAGKQGVLLRFEQPLDRGSATNARNYAVTRWNYRRTEQYGSGHFTLDGAPGEEKLPVAAAHLSEDGTELLLVMPDVQPVMQLQLDYAITAADGTALNGPVYLTLNDARPLDLEAAGFGDVDWQQDAQRASDLIAGTPSAETVAATAKRGRHIYQEVGCVTCHALDGSQQVGPSFQNLFGAERTLASGETVVADEAYIEQSIWAPARQVVEGYASNMPAYEGILSEAEVESLILFIKSLSTTNTPSEAQAGTGASP
jgi:mono/diheme cytochrome c family protein